MTETEFREWLVGEGGETLWRLVWSATRYATARPERYGLSRDDIRQSAAVHALDAVRRTPAILCDPAAVLKAAVDATVNEMRSGYLDRSIPKVAYVDDIRASVTDRVQDEADVADVLGELLERFGGVMVRRVLDRMSPSQRAALRLSYMGDDAADHPPVAVRSHVGPARKRFRVLWERAG